MPKTSTKEPSRGRAKNSAVLEAVNSSIRKIQELLPQVEDLKQEGFPYRDALRARTELHVRECVRQVFGERSPEAQQWKNYRVRSTSPSEVAETISQLHGLVAQLERKKLELLGVAPPPAPTRCEPAAPVAPSPGTAIAPSIPHQPTAVTIIPVTPVSMAIPMTANLVVTSTAASQQSQASAPQSSPLPAPSRAQKGPDTPIAPEPREQVRDTAIQAEAPAAAPRPLVPTLPPSAGILNPHPLTDTPGIPSESAPPASPAGNTVPADPLDIIRKVCSRFHRVARQLRLRREYRPTLEVEDERDVLDLLCTLLRYEMEEVSVHEWTPSYQDSTPSTALVLPRHRIAVLAKKTRAGLGPREISQQLTADNQEFSPGAGYQTILCFVYDPEGRIGNPRGMEADLTKVSDAQVTEVVIYPK